MGLPDLITTSSDYSSFTSVLSLMLKSQSVYEAEPDSADIKNNEVIEAHEMKDFECVTPSLDVSTNAEKIKQKLESDLTGLDLTHGIPNVDDTPVQIDPRLKAMVEAMPMESFAKPIPETGLVGMERYLATDTKDGGVAFFRG